MRRISHSIVLFTMIAGSALFATGAVVAQDEPSALDDLGLPTLDITVTDTGYEGIPEELEAGRYLVTIEVQAEEHGGVTFIQPVGVTTDEFLAAVSGPPPGAGEALEGDASPEAGGEEMGGPPSFFYESVMAGGVAAGTGETAQVVLDLTEGEWVAWGDDPSAPQEPVVFNVTGELPADLPEPEADVTLTMDEMSIEVTDGELVAGEQLVKVENIGEQPHFILFVQGPDGLTEDDVAAVLEAEMTGTPAAVDFNPDEDLIDVAATGTQSSGTEIWMQLDDLEAGGTYVLICFVPDPSGVPHAFMGMYEVVEVAE